MDKVKEVVNKVIHPSEAKHADTTHTGTHTTGTHTTGTHTGTHGAGAAGTSGTAGPHSSNAANKADPRVDSDLDGSRNAGAAQYGAGAHNNNHNNTGLTGQHDTAGPYSSNLANKADPRVDSDMDGSRNAGAASYGAGAHNHGNTGFTGSNTSGTAGTHGSSTAGPHSSNLANKLDPRVDSDNDGSRNVGAAKYGAGAHQSHGTTGSGLTGSNHGTTGTGLTGGHGSSTNAGPHDSNALNKADPRVDSDRDGSRNAGAASYGPGAHNNHGTTGTGLTGGYGTSTNAGPHDSNALNKADPRVDSDRDGSRNAGAASYGPGAHNNHGTTGTGLTGGYGSSTNAGPHDSNALNKADPRVDSDRDGSHNAGAASYGPGAHNNHGTTGTGLTGNHGTTGSGLTGSNQGTHGHVGGLATGGPAPNTAGPHKSDMFNKVDPRVDSDRDGSRTVGQAPAPQY